MRVVICDASPIHYLVLIDEVELLSKLYTRVIIPSSVARELNRHATPQTIRQWIGHPPHWLEISRLDPVSTEALSHLDEGERDAISLALQVDADLVLMDERAGVQQAKRLGLTVTGTIGVLDRAAERKLVDLPAAIAKLQLTNFRISPVLLDRLSKGRRSTREVIFHPSASSLASPAPHMRELNQCPNP